MLIPDLIERFLADGHSRNRWQRGRALSIQTYLRRFGSFETQPDPELERPGTGERGGILIRAYRDLRVDQVVRRDIESWLWSIGKRRGKRGKPITVTQVKEHRQAVTSMLDHGCDLGLMHSSSSSGPCRQ